MFAQWNKHVPQFIANSHISLDKCGLRNILLIMEAFIGSLSSVWDKSCCMFRSLSETTPFCCFVTYEIQSNMFLLPHPHWYFSFLRRKFCSSILMYLHKKLLLVSSTVHAFVQLQQPMVQFSSNLSFKICSLYLIGNIKAVLLRQFSIIKKITWPGNGIFGILRISKYCSWKSH